MSTSLYYNAEKSPLSTNISLPQDELTSAPFMHPNTPSNTDSETTFSSPNGSLYDSILLHTPDSSVAQGHLPDVKIFTGHGHHDSPTRGVEPELFTPTAYSEKQGSGDTIRTSTSIGQSPRPNLAHNALGLMMEKAASTNASAASLRSEHDGQTPPADTEPPLPTPDTTVSRQFAMFLKSLNGHQLIVEPEADRRIRISLGPFVVSVLPIAPQ